jgi:hypothetical protein
MFVRIASTKSGTEALNYVHTILRRSEYFILLTAIVFNKHNFECLSHNYWKKPQQNLEFPKYHIGNPPPTIQETFGEQGRNCPGVCNTPPSLYLIGYICTIPLGVGQTRKFSKYLSVSD